ncbi:hypothetical protein CAPTEDRAFT_194026 [Capitella teleta]|uniref:Uncharacterized protein n=1 Tax=Capitella teleta TaxID=283909 RepID=R7UWB1_CAPTE|nr:hypothetical protein CAPTEDRAFT_194026 [Capitella teleta]|eukprot:ELU10557.1 hypothetical protein CAPTEDRAFT_194026 [Capitella teleta]
MSTVGWQPSPAPFYSAPQGPPSFIPTPSSALGSSFAASSAMKSPLGLDQRPLLPSNDRSYYAAVSAKDIQKIVDVTSANPGLMRSVTSLGRMESNMESRKNFTTEFNIRIPDTATTQGYNPPHLSRDPVNKPFNTQDRISAALGTHSAESDLGLTGPTIHIPVSDKPTYNTHQKYLFRDNTTSHLQLKTSSGGSSFNKYMFKDIASAPSHVPSDLEEKTPPSKDLSPTDVKSSVASELGYRSSAYDNSLRGLENDLKKSVDYSSKNHRPWLGYGNLNNNLSRPSVSSDLPPPIFTQPSQESRLTDSSNLTTSLSRYGDSSLRFAIPALKYESQFRAGSAGIPADYIKGRSATSSEISLSPRSFNRRTSAPAGSFMEEVANRSAPVLPASATANKKPILKKVSSYADPTFTRTFLNDVPLLNGHAGQERLPRLPKGGRGSKRVTFNLMCNRKHSYEAEEKEPYVNPYIWSQNLLKPTASGSDCMHRAVKSPETANITHSSPSCNVLILC